MTKLTPVITNRHKDNAAAVLHEAIDENPDTVIVLLFWSDRGEYSIKCSTVPDRLMLIGALEEAKNKVVVDGFVRNE